MPGFTTFIPLVLMLLFGAFAIYRWVTASKGMIPGIRMFLDRTGYRLPNAVSPDLEASVARWVAEWNSQKSQGRYDVLLARQYHGLPISQRTLMGPEGPQSNRYIMSAWWRAELAGPARVGFHIAERKFGGLGQRLSGLMTNMQRNFQARYSVAIQTGDPQFDRRFQIYGVDAGGVAQLLAHPGLKQALVALPEVDLFVGDQMIVFNDPEQKNMRAGMGGTFGAMAMSGNMGKMLEISIGVHEQVSHLLLLTAQAVSGPPAYQQPPVNPPAGGQAWGQ